MDSERQRHAAVIADLQAQREAEEAQFSATMESLMQQRNDEALREKLKGYPAKLVQEHATCVCGAAMRPFAVVEGEKVVKYWACSNGGLTDEHDKVKV